MLLTDSSMLVFVHDVVMLIQLGPPECGDLSMQPRFIPRLESHAWLPRLMCYEMKVLPIRWDIDD